MLGRARGVAVASVVVMTMTLVAGCYRMRPSAGGGSARVTGDRVVDAADVAVPAGYRVDLVARDLTFPTAAVFDADGRLHVVEAGYSYGETFATPRLLRVEPGARTTVIASGDHPPWTGAVFQAGAFYIAAGGQVDGGQILRVTPDGRITVLVDGLPSLGDHHTNGPANGPDGWLYFGQGTATNSGVVGLDNAEFGWLARHPDFHDIPCHEVTLAGVNFATATVHGAGRTSTGGFSAFGTATRQGQSVPGRVPCTGAIMRVRLGGSAPEVVAWGLRNPFGLAFGTEGRLYVTENGYDVRGSRPVFGAADQLWLIEPGRWYGWPDFAGGRPLSEGRFKPPGKQAPGTLLAIHPNAPPVPLASFGVNSSATGLDVCRDRRFGHEGELFVALFGDMAPKTGKVLAPVGFKVVRVEPKTGVIQDFMVNRGTTNGPASWLGRHGLERPVSVRFDPSGRALYVVDFGILTMDSQGPKPYRGTGVVWRITRDETG
jgi:glucose/arabinose dehydrogenase